MKKSRDKDMFNPVIKDLKVRVEPRPHAPPHKDTHKEPEPLHSPLSEEEQAFMEAMEGVTPLTRSGKRAHRSELSFTRPAHPPPDEKRAAMEHLDGLVRGFVEMDISFTDEYMEGAVTGVARKTMRRLKQGRFPIQDHVDLHGLTQKEARDRVQDFLMKSHKTGHRCVLIVHGRGRNSPLNLPVLKEQLPIWFNRGPVRKVVLAFATARPYDGGAGAMYVLLRRR